MQHQNNKKTDSKTNYEDCFVYDESRFTGNGFIGPFKGKVMGKQYFGSGSPLNFFDKFKSFF